GLNLGLLTTVFALLITDFFDTMGTVIAIGSEANFLDKEGRLPRLKNVLLVDSIAAMVGGIFGASSVTTYIESAAGVGEGGRTGLTSVVTGILFLLAMFLAPIAGIVPQAATAPALIIVGFLMMTIVKDIKFDQYDEAIPAFLILLGIPLTYNISYGIGLGFISYVVIKALRGKFSEIHPLMWLTAIGFAVNFFFQAR
ncbi:MAG: solute carrier family 23 protein, partial [Chitinophagales bacterium]